MKVVVVTDPMCSWCWGMAPAIEQAATRLAGEVEFDILLGGINIHGTQPIGAYGRRHLMRIWREVTATTGQTFGFRLPESFVYNSTLPCIAVQSMRRWLGKAPFGYLHRLQQIFFLEGRNINDAGVLADAAGELGWDGAACLRALDDPELARQVAEQFAASRSYGTNALPSVLWESDAQRTLLAGGYVDADMLAALITARS